MHNKVPKNEYLKGKPGKKQNPYKKDVIYDPRGQWDYPGEVTKIPSGDITMQGVPYPVLGVDNLGYEQMMYPGLDYQFPGDTVTEYPQMQYGGDPSIPELDQAKKGGAFAKYPKLPKKTSSKNIKSSINKLMVKNPLFQRNYMLYGAKGPRLYDPKSKYQMGGWLDSYQDGGVTINSEEEYKKSLLMKNKTKERMDAERAWVAKKVAAQNKAKVQQTSGLPSSQQQAAMFGIKPVAAESTGIAAKPVYTPKEKEDIQKAQYQAKREKAREKVRATYGPQGSNPRALYDEEGLINSYLGAQERQQKKEQEMKFLGTGLLAGAVAGPAVLGAVGSGIAAVPSTLAAAGTALEAPGLGLGSSYLPSALTLNNLQRSYFIAKALQNTATQTAPLAYEAYQNPSIETIVPALTSLGLNMATAVPSFSSFAAKPFLVGVGSAPAAMAARAGLSEAEQVGLYNLDKFIRIKGGIEARKALGKEINAAATEPTQEYTYPVTPRRGLYSDNPYYPAIPESTGTAPIYYAQNLIAPAESTGVAVKPNWLNNYR